MRSKSWQHFPFISNFVIFKVCAISLCHPAGALFDYLCFYDYVTPLGLCLIIYVFMIMSPRWGYCMNIIFYDAQPLELIEPFERVENVIRVENVKPLQPHKPLKPH
jgi:hypothetical protein